MTDEFEDELDVEVDDIDEISEDSISYQLWLIGSRTEPDGTQNVLHESLLATDSDMDKIINLAEELYDDPAEAIKKILEVDKTIDCLTILGTAIVKDVDDDISTIYQRKIEILKK